VRELLIVGSFAHDAERILAAVYGLALVGFVLGCNIGQCIMSARLELGIATFTHSDNRGRGFFDDPQSPIRHEASLAHPAVGWNACGFQTAPVPNLHRQGGLQIGTHNLEDHARPSRMNKSFKAVAMKLS
jgi:hypothetical protein